MIPRRGEIFWAADPAETGLEKRRMVLIIQNEIGNRNSSYTIVATIRHDSHKFLPVQVALSRGTAGLQKDSVIDCGHIATLHKNKLENYVGYLTDLQMHQVNKALKISLELP